MSEELVDAIVVGAGPAGSAAAITLARAGRRVLLLDRAAFPRDKPCGDLIGARALAWARSLGIDDAALAPYPSLAGAMITTDGGALDLTPSTTIGRRLLASSDARVIPRAAFDAAMVAAAERAGAEVRQVRVREVSAWENESREVLGKAPDGPVRLRASAVILAGGYGCHCIAESVPSPLRTGTVPPRGIAMRGYFGRVDSPMGRIVFCLNDWVLPGYGWTFPLPDGGANVGVGTLTQNDTSGGEHLRELYRRFTQDASSPAFPWLADAEATGTPRSWPLDLGPRSVRLVADGLLVSGEAASLVGPLTGAGIAFALESGAFAGETLADALDRGEPRANALKPYAQHIRRRALPWLRAERIAQRWLSDPNHIRTGLQLLHPLPLTSMLGARILLHLG